MISDWSDPSSAAFFIASALIVKDSNIKLNNLQDKLTAHHCALGEKNGYARIINQGLLLEPKNAGAYFQLGNARLMQSKLNLALIAFQKATNIKPQFWEALNNQGLVLFEMGKTTQAIQTWRNVLIISQNAEPMLALAAALNRVKPNNQESIELASKALSKNPNYVLATHQSEQLWGRKLQEATKKLLKNPKLLSAVEKALTNSEGNK